MSDKTKRYPLQLQRHWFDLKLSNKVEIGKSPQNNNKGDEVF